MMTQQRNVLLAGELAEQFGASHRLAVASVREAVTALDVLYPGFRAALAACIERGMGFRVTVADRDITDDEVALVSVGDILIAPVVLGANAGVSAVLGVGLIAASFYFTGGTATALLMAGGGMAIGGVVGMMTKIPAVSAGQIESGASQKNYLFGGSQNTGVQGVPVPVGVGEMIYSGIVISAGIDVEDIV